MTKLIYNSIKHNEKELVVRLSVDVQNHWVEVTHIEELSHVMNKTTGEHIIVKRNSLNVEVESSV